MTDRRPIIAIDGPAGSGKSTVAKLAAERAGLQFVSSGSMYRAVALYAMREGISQEERRLVELARRLQFRFTTDRKGVVHTYVNDEDATDELRDPPVGSFASSIATIPELRSVLVAKQQDYGKHGGIVMEGRDIQTVVFPDADIKIFLTASAEERARRRWKELLQRGEKVDFQAVITEVQTRDKCDAERDVSPLRPADDSICVDTDKRTIEEVVDLIVQLIQCWRENPDLHGKPLASCAGISKG